MSGTPGSPAWRPRLRTKDLKASLSISSALSMESDVGVTRGVEFVSFVRIADTSKLDSR